MFNTIASRLLKSPQFTKSVHTLCKTIPKDFKFQSNLTGKSFTSSTNIFKSTSTRQFSSSSSTEDEDKLTIFKIPAEEYKNISTTIRLGLVTSLASIGFGFFAATIPSGFFRWFGLIVAALMFIRSSASIHTLSRSPVEINSVWPRTIVADSMTQNQEDDSHVDADEDLSGEALYSSNHPEFLDVTRLNTGFYFGISDKQPQVTRHRLKELIIMSKTNAGAFPYFTEEDMEIFKSKKLIPVQNQVILCDVGKKSNTNGIMILSPYYITHYEAFNQVINAANKNHAELAKSLMLKVQQDLKEKSVKKNEANAAAASKSEKNFDFVQEKRNQDEKEQFSQDGGKISEAEIIEEPTKETTESTETIDKTTESQEKEETQEKK